MTTILELDKNWIFTITTQKIMQKEYYLNWFD